MKDQRVPVWERTQIAFEQEQELQIVTAIKKQLRILDQAEIAAMRLKFKGLTQEVLTFEYVRYWDIVEKTGANKADKHQCLAVWIGLEQLCKEGFVQRMERSSREVYYRKVSNLE